MGWASGSGLLSEVWATVRDHIPEAERAYVLIGLMEAFIGYDCDTVCEVDRKEWLEVRRALNVLYDLDEEYD